MAPLLITLILGELLSADLYVLKTIQHKSNMHVFPIEVEESTNVFVQGVKVKKCQKMK